MGRCPPAGAFDILINPRELASSSSLRHREATLAQGHAARQSTALSTQVTPDFPEVEWNRNWPESSEKAQCPQAQRGLKDGRGGPGIGLSDYPVLFQPAPLIGRWICSDTSKLSFKVPQESQLFSGPTAPGNCLKTETQDSTPLSKAMPTEAAPQLHTFPAQNC